MVEWYVYALITMLFFSLANITMKSILSKEFTSVFEKNPGIFLPIIAILVLAVLVIYVLFISKLNLPKDSLMLIVTFILLASIGFICLMIAVSVGKISLVTAIVSTSTIMVAIISVVFLKESLNTREIAGIALAFTGILLLAFGK